MKKYCNLLFVIGLTIRTSTGDVIFSNFFTDPNKKLEKFLFKNLDISFDKINFFDEDFQSCELRQTCSILFSQITSQSIPYRVSNMNLRVALNESNALNVVTENPMTQEFLGRLSSSSLINNFWIIPVWMGKSSSCFLLCTKKHINESKIAATEAAASISHKLRVNSQFYTILISNNTIFTWRNIEIVEVYRITSYIPLQLNILNGSDASIWVRRKNLMGANMTIGFIDSFEVRPFYNLNELLDDEAYFSGHLQNGSQIYIRGANIEYLKIFQACFFVYLIAAL